MFSLFFLYINVVKDVFNHIRLMYMYDIVQFNWFNKSNLRDILFPLRIKVGH